MIRGGQESQQLEMGIGPIEDGRVEGAIYAIH